MISPGKVYCDVYKSGEKEDIYLYVDHAEGLDKVPEGLLQQFGELKIALSFILTENRGLAKEDPKRVLQNLLEQGYHLQLPPAEDL
jgi:uncharacterized protein YcgL (UPF0745 family)